MDDKAIKPPHNLYLLPFIMGLLQFCFLAVSLFGSGFDFENQILITSFLLVCLWGLSFIAVFLSPKKEI